jgi:hypothetical protein
VGVPSRHENKGILTLLPRAGGGRRSPSTNQHPTENGRFYPATSGGGRLSAPHSRHGDSRAAGHGDSDCRSLRQAWSTASSGPRGGSERDFCTTRSVRCGHGSPQGRSGGCGRETCERSGGCETRHGSSGGEASNGRGRKTCHGCSSRKTGDSCGCAVCGSCSSFKASDGDGSRKSSDGDGSREASTGDGSRKSSDSDSCCEASNGDSSRKASNGDSSRKASNGDSSCKASNGNSSRKASNGNSSRKACDGVSRGKASHCCCRGEASDRVVRCNARRGKSCC